MSILLVILVLSFLVIIHEMGHLLVALWSKVGVEEFGLGYPPKAKHLFTWKQIPFTLNWIPFGGFVRLKGEDAQVGSPVQKDDFRAAARGKRIAIIVAGVVVNFLFGVLVFSTIYTFTGIPTQLTEARIGAVQEGSPAAQAQLPAEVTIVAVETVGGVVQTPTVPDAQHEILAHRGETISLHLTGGCIAAECAKDGQIVDVYVRTEAETPDGEGAIGIGFQQAVLQKYPLWQMPFRGAVYGTKEAIDLGKQIILALGDLVRRLVTTGEVPADVAGPIGIAAQAQQLQLANQGWVTMIVFAAMISINLAIMNILPIPPLDGGRLFFLLLEPIVKKKHLEKIEYWANYSGFIVLIGLIVLISIRDVWNLFA
jgi:regulator of sigma E protease